MRLSRHLLCALALWAGQLFLAGGPATAAQSPTPIDQPDAARPGAPMPDPGTPGAAPTLVTPAPPGASGRPTGPVPNSQPYPMPMGPVPSYQSYPSPGAAGPSFADPTPLVPQDVGPIYSSPAQPQPAYQVPVRDDREPVYVPGPPNGGVSRDGISPPPGTLGQTYARRSRLLPDEKHPRVGMVDVYLPEDADVTARGLKPKWTGKVWRLESDGPLVPGMPHIYAVQAVMNRDGQKVTEVRWVRLIMGRIVDLDF